MADKTKIEWADATLNYINGCSVLSPGCTNCYAMSLAGTRLKHHPSRAGLTTASKAGPVWTGEVRAHEPALLQALRWKAPRRIFWNAHGDTFHDAVPDEWIDRLFAVCALTPQHQHLILTKRSARMREYLSCPAAASRIYDLVCDWAINGTADVVLVAPFTITPPDGQQVQLGVWPLPNVWLGVSVEDQARADERVPDLLATPSAVRWISAEPLLGPVDLRWIAEPDDEKDGVIDALLGCNWIERENGEEFRPARPGHQDRIMRRWVCSPEADIIANRKLDWIAVGGESGAGSRPMHPDWARSLRDQCLTAGVPFFFKQWGDWELSLDRELVDPDWRADYSNDYVDAGKSRWLNIEGGRGFHGKRFVVMRRTGKKAAGRLLDGREWNELPE